MKKNEEIIIKANLNNANLTDVDESYLHLNNANLTDCNEFDSYLSNAKFSLESECECSKILQKMLTEIAHKMKSIVKK